MQTFILDCLITSESDSSDSLKLLVGGEMGVSDEGGYPPLSIGVNNSLNLVIEKQAF
jgi:hypothetical protein